MSLLTLARVLQVHDFAQTLKECEKQIKQLEIASVGKLRPQSGLVFCVSSDWQFIPRYVSADGYVCLLQLSSGPQEMRCQGPYPHVYQEDAQGGTQPVVPQDELRQQAATTMGTAGPQSSVRVQDLATISQKHVCCLSRFFLLVLVVFYAVG